MIEVRNITFSYGDHMVLDHLSFSAGKGKMIAVLGANGAGKSTLFRCMLGILRPQDGIIEIDGRDISHMSRREISSKIAYIPQSETPVYNYTVFDTVLMGTAGSLSPLRSPGKKQTEASQNALSLLGITDLSDRGINEISGGERQLALLARAIAQQSPALLMDEPTANLDYGNQHMVLSRIRELANEGYTIMLSTHNPEHALQYADEVLVIKDHRVFASGIIQDVLTQELIYEVYGLRVRTAEVETDGRTIRSFIALP